MASLQLAPIWFQQLKRAVAANRNTKALIIIEVSFCACIVHLTQCTITVLHSASLSVQTFDWYIMPNISHHTIFQCTCTGASNLFGCPLIKGNVNIIESMTDQSLMQILTDLYIRCVLKPSSSEYLRIVFYCSGLSNWTFVVALALEVEVMLGLWGQHELGLVNDPAVLNMGHSLFHIWEHLWSYHCISSSCHTSRLSVTQQFTLLLPMTWVQ